MAWDWDTDDIDADEDDRKQWVPVTPQTMKIAETPRPGRIDAPTLPVMPIPPQVTQKMSMYVLHLTRGALAEQASTPMVIPVLSPTGHRPVIIKKNIGEGARQRDEETTADSEGESELTELLIMPKVWREEKKAPSRK